MLFTHKCHIDDFKLIGDRPNPLNSYWLPWCLAICTKCKTIQEWQIHSEEQMHGGALECTALPTQDYIQHKYKLSPSDIEDILSGKREAFRYNNYKQQFENT